MAASALVLSGPSGLRGRGVAGGHDRQSVGERSGCVLGANVGDLDVEPESLRPVAEEVAIAEQVECRELQLISAQPRLDGDIGPDTRGFA